MELTTGKCNKVDNCEVEIKIFFKIEILKVQCSDSSSYN